MNDEEIKDAIENIKDIRLSSGCTQAEQAKWFESIGVLKDLAQLYLSIAGKMPEEKKGRFVVEAQDGGHWVMTERAEGFNQARQECILAQMKGLPSVEHFSSAIRMRLEVGVKDDEYTNNGMYKKGIDPKVTCWHCKKTFLCDCMDATCRLCGAPYAKERCKEFNFTPQQELK